MKLKTTILLLLITTILNAQHTYLANSYKTTYLLEEECLKQAEVSIRNIKATDIYISNVAVYGDLGNDSLLIRCISDKKMVFFLVSSLDKKRSNKLLKKIQSSF